MRGKSSGKQRMRNREKGQEDKPKGKDGDKRKAKK